MLVFSRAIALLVLAVLAGSASAAVVLMPLSGRGVPAAAGGSADASLYVQVEAVAGSSPSPPAPLRSAAVPGPNPVWPRVLDMALDGFGTLVGSRASAGWIGAAHGAQGATAGAGDPPGLLLPAGAACRKPRVGRRRTT